MKQVLMIDTAPSFRDFLKETLKTRSTAVESVSGIRSAFTRLIKLLPDLIIIDFETIESILPFLEQKKADINAAKIPVVLIGAPLEREQVATVIPLGVVKSFKKPIKYDLFLDSIGKILGTTFSVDDTPCVLNLHVHEKVIFVELAQGLNREKIALLKYSIPELIAQHNMELPKTIIMLTDLELSFLDGANLELLIDSVIASKKILNKNVTVLSLNTFVKELIYGHEKYEGIRVVQNISDVLQTVVKRPFSSDDEQTVISETLLTASRDHTESLDTRFVSESISRTENDTGTLFHAAIVDDQAIFRNMLKTALASIGGESELFESGADFLGAIETRQYDLIILDILMPGFSGLEVLSELAEKQNNTPVIIYSQAMQKDAVVRALSLGAKTYLVKPQKPETILAKCIEVLKHKAAE